MVTDTIEVKRMNLMESLKKINNDMKKDEARRNNISYSMLNPQTILDKTSLGLKKEDIVMSPDEIITQQKQYKEELDNLTSKYRNALKDKAILHNAGSKIKRFDQLRREYFLVTTKDLQQTIEERAKTLNNIKLESITVKDFLSSNGISNRNDYIRQFEKCRSTVQDYPEKIKAILHKVEEMEKEINKTRQAYKNKLKQTLNKTNKFDAFNLSIPQVNNSNGNYELKMNLKLLDNIYENNLKTKNYIDFIGKGKGTEQKIKCENNMEIK